MQLSQNKRIFWRIKTKAWDCCQKQSTSLYGECRYSERELISWYLGILWLSGFIGCDRIVAVVIFIQSIPFIYKNNPDIPDSFV